MTALAPPPPTDRQPTNVPKKAAALSFLSCPGAGPSSLPLRQSDPGQLHGEGSGTAPTHGLSTVLFGAGDAAARGKPLLPFLPFGGGAFPFRHRRPRDGAADNRGEERGFFYYTRSPPLSQKEAFSLEGVEGRGGSFHVGKSRSNSSRRSASLPGFFLFLSPSVLSWERLRLRCLRLLLRLRLRIDVAPDSERGEEEAAAKRRGFNNSATFVRRPPLPHPSSPLRTFASYRPTQVSNSVGEGRGRENGRGPRLSPRPKASPSCNKGRWGMGEGGIKQWPHRTARRRRRDCPMTSCSLHGKKLAIKNIPNK